jgi:putative hydrolase of the HAD superfamily
VTDRRAVIFDLDNTLILEDEATRAAVRVAASRAQERANLDTEAVSAAVGDAAARLWKAAPAYSYGEAFGIWWGEALWGGFTSPNDELRPLRDFLPTFRERVWRDALSSFGVDDPALASEMQEMYVRVRRARELIDPDAEPLLADLRRDHHLALLSNGAGDVQREKLSRTPFAPYFEAIVVSTEVGIGKPDPRIFEITLSRLGIAKEDATMVGDSLLRDVAGARRAGVRAIWIDRGLEQHADVRPDATVLRLSGLRAALDELERRPVSPPATT